MTGVKERRFLLVEHDYDYEQGDGSPETQDSRLRTGD
jgi:hypothetical protein